MHETCLKVVTKQEEQRKKKEKKKKKVHTLVGVWSCL